MPSEASEPISLSEEAAEQEVGYDAVEDMNRTRRWVAFTALIVYAAIVLAYSIAVIIGFFYGKPGRDLVDAGLAMTGPLGAIVGGVVGFYFARPSDPS